MRPSSGRDRCQDWSMPPATIATASCSHRLLPTRSPGSCWTERSSPRSGPSGSNALHRRAPRNRFNVMTQESETMGIRVNGEVEPLIAATLAALLAEKEVDVAQRGIAVALNGSVVPRSAWSETVLKPGDSVEIVRARQGG